MLFFTSNKLKSEYWTLVLQQSIVTYFVHKNIGSLFFLLNLSPVTMAISFCKGYGWNGWLKHVFRFD